MWRWGFHTSAKILQALAWALAEVENSNRLCYFGSLKGVSNSVQVLFNGTQQCWSDLDNSEIASEMSCAT